MKTDKEQYIAPAVEVIEMEAQNIIAASDLASPTFDDDPTHDAEQQDFWGK